jgi:hypothetical protein
MHLSPELLWWLAAASLVMFVGTLIVVPMLVVRIPPDYFVRTGREAPPWIAQHPIIRGIVLIAKNAVGAVFVLVGLLLLVLPGQGLLTIFVGIVLLDFPGKFKLERWIISRGPVGRSINWLRRRSNRGPIDIPKG